jgi:hypothetical protein
MTTKKINRLPAKHVTLGKEKKTASVRAHRLRQHHHDNTSASSIHDRGYSNCSICACASVAKPRSAKFLCRTMSDFASASESLRFWACAGPSSSWPARKTFSLLKIDVSKSSDVMAAPHGSDRAAASGAQAAYETGKETLTGARGWSDPHPPTTWRPETAAGAVGALGAAAAARVLGWDKARVVEAAMAQCKCR